jgi:predicted TIM-barrel fold metal-dependent hydrolase
MPIRMPSYDGDRTLPPGSEEVAAAWRQWMEPCIDAFGAERSMYESNFPVQKRWCSYQVCWNAFKRISAGASASEKADLFAGTAARAYRTEGVL